ncbi:TPA: P-loop NTPase [Candidatus Woesearchaeota archaeon]|nr:P-loop NTPase [Candidatus Woesearchaeota archaeon]
MTKTIAFFSGCGGSGKTTSAVNLAAALAARGLNTILIDGSLASPHVGMHLGFPDLAHTIHEVLEGRCTIAKATYIHPCGMLVMPGSSRNHAPQHRRSVADILLQLYGKSHLVLVDTSHDAATAAPFLKASEETILVAGAHDPIESITRARDIAYSYGSTVIALLANRCSLRQGKQLSEKAGIPLLEAIPPDSHIRISLQRKQPLVHLHPHAKAARSFQKAAELLHYA